MSQKHPVDERSTRKVDALIANPRNARTHPPEQIKFYAASIREFGFTRPVLIDEKDMILAGHGAVLAAKEEGIKDVPVAIARGWTDERKSAYLEADNRIWELGGWNDELRAENLMLLRDSDIDFETVGWDMPSLQEYLGVERAASDVEAVPHVPTATFVRKGDLWVLGTHRIICGDATDRADVQRLLAGDKPHLMVTDPPYGVEYDPEWRDRVYRSNGTKVGVGARGKVNNDHRDDWKEAWDLFPGDVAYVWHGSLHGSIVEDSLLRAGFIPRTQIVWNKGRMVIGRSDYHWQHEPCWYVVRKGKKGHWNGDRTQTSVWDIAKPHASETGHSTQKPIECMQRPMRNNSKAGDFVYEPFSGSGTTIIAAETCGRKCLAVEIDPAYVEVTLRRWADVTKGMPTLDGVPLDRVERERTKKPGARAPRASRQKPADQAAGGTIAKTAS